MTASDSDCIFCRIIKGTIPCLKVWEDDKTLAFLDIYPISYGHVLIIPKHHSQFLHQLPDDHLQSILPVAKRIASVFHSKEGGGAYNLLQNNGKVAHQEINHVHFHLIPKNGEEDGLGVKWPVQHSLSRPKLEELQKDLLLRLKE